MKILRITAQGLPLFIVQGVWHPVHAKTGGDLCDRARFYRMVYSE